jgi:hypothetical protein
MSQLAQLAQVFVVLARVGWLGHWLHQVGILTSVDSTCASSTNPPFVRAEIHDAYQLKWHWAVFEETADTTPGTPRYCTTEGGMAASKMDAKVSALAAAVAMQHRYPLSLQKLIALALVRLDAEMDGRAIP